MNNIISVGKDCCGCLVCGQTCPKNEIKVQKKNGYSYPEISNCINCGSCVDVCPVLGSDKIKNERTETVYIAKNKETEIRKDSTSGGLFTNFAKRIISHGGVVYGAGFDADMNVCHYRADNDAELKGFRGSKYVQSDITKILPQLVSDLNEKKLCLFSGTPCQVAAVKLYCEKNAGTENLITLEILCYGVPSPEIFKEHIAAISEKYNSKVKKYCFRDQREGCKQYYIHSAELEDGRMLYRDSMLQGLEELYRYHYNVRESCFDCKFIGQERCADITLGDCWGINNINKDFADDFGISQVLINTSKGKELWEQIKDGVHYFETNLRDIIQYNGVYLSGPKKPEDYEAFWKYYNKNGYMKTLKSYTPFGGTSFKVKRKLRKFKKRIFTK